MQAAVDGTSCDSTQNGLDGQEDHGWEAAVVTIDEGAERLLQILIEDEVEAAAEAKDKEVQDYSPSNKDFVQELEGKSHKTLPEEQVG